MDCRRTGRLNYVSTVLYKLHDTGGKNVYPIFTNEEHKIKKKL